MVVILTAIKPTKQANSANFIESIRLSGTETALELLITNTIVGVHFHDSLLRLEFDLFLSALRLLLEHQIQQQGSVLQFGKLLPNFFQPSSLLVFATSADSPHPITIEFLRIYHQSSTQT
ncbi:hypothetical protein EAF00_007794 [Botryotinia globosa]|nr:hypothetical protein EAF00_007794 [Botryotinia globosa]